MKIITGLQGVDGAMRERILKMLSQIEAEYSVQVLFACESGSRGWGFASPDSDYDVRFIYVHKPEWYLRVESPRDVIEKPVNGELDICGWEFRKALGLLKRANPTLIEWLDSPIIYRQNEAVMAQIKTLSTRYFSSERARWHYRSMAHKNFQHYLQSDEVRLKKYFYVLRPLLAVRWIEAGKGAPPVRFEELLAGTVSEGALWRNIAELLAVKQRAGEAQYGPRRPVLDNFITTELARAEATLAPSENLCDDRLLDALLFKTVMENDV